MVMTLKLEHNQALQLEPVVAPPAKPQKANAEPPPVTAQKEQKHGLFSKVGAFFATLFH